MRRYRITVETAKHTYLLVESELDLRQAPEDAIFEHHLDGCDEDGYTTLYETIVRVEDVTDD